jgi:hypothetical protein
VAEYRLSCGCIPDASGYGYCGKCTMALRKKIWAKMSDGEKDYDRRFGGEEIAELEYEYDREQTCCSCHINPPCSYCTSKSEEDYE